jgi:formylglycine-generating enzyme required for sulfatase activity
MFIYSRGGSLLDISFDCEVGIRCRSGASDYHHNVGFRLCWRCM